MSSLAPQIRARLPRLPEHPSVRSRLSLVPSGRTTARRTPFAALVFTLLAGGIVGLLMFNTQMQQDAFHATALQDRATALHSRQQSLDMELMRLRDPQSVALRARGLGMVVPADPAFLRLSDGHLLGTPTTTTMADQMRVRGYPAASPARLAPKARIVRVPAAPPALTTGQTAGQTDKNSQRHGAASATTSTRDVRNKRH